MRRDRRALDRSIGVIWPPSVCVSTTPTAQVGGGHPRSVHVGATRASRPPCRRRIHPRNDPQEPEAVRRGCAFGLAGRVGLRREMAGRAPHGANREGWAGENGCGSVRVRKFVASLIGGGAITRVLNCLSAHHGADVSEILKASCRTCTETMSSNLVAAASRWWPVATVSTRPKPSENSPPVREPMLPRCAIKPFA